jgi:hypothetical protein
MFKSARKVGTPLIAISTPDAAATMAAHQTITNGAPVIRWTIASGPQAYNEPGRQALAQMLGGNDPSLFNNPTEFLLAAQQLPASSIAYMLNAQRVVTEPGLAGFSAIQAIWNLRDTFKANQRTLVLLGTPTITMPPELASDVLAIDEPLPDPEAIDAIVRSQIAAFTASCEKSGVTPPVIDDGVISRANDAVCGLAAYPTEQSVAMSLSRSGLDVPALWERKRQLIASARGLSVYRGTETFDDIRGNQNAVNILKQIFSPNARRKYKACIFIDEIEKAMAGSGDSSGVSQDLLLGVLTEMQDTEASGILCVSPPGCGKSMLAKCLGNYAGVPLITYDIGGLKDQYVGNSGANQRNAHKVIRAVAMGPAFWIATSNAVANLPPELRRRFADATLYFDLPSAPEAESIWTLYRNKWELPDPIPLGCEGWTGAEIRTCCRIAYDRNIPLADAAQNISPVCRTAREVIRKLRMEASGNYVSANYPGIYQYNETAPITGGQRSFGGV